MGTFSHNDQVLDTAVLLGALPPRVAGITDPLDRYFAAASGTDTVEPPEMTTWFDTNYHYPVPEITAETTFALHSEQLLKQVDEALALGVPARPVVIDPVTFLKSAEDASGAPLRRLPALVPLSRDLLARLATKGVARVQIDEPVLVTESHRIRDRRGAVRAATAMSFRPRLRPAPRGVGLTGFARALDGA